MERHLQEGWSGINKYHNNNIGKNRASWLLIKVGFLVLLSVALISPDIVQGLTIRYFINVMSVRLQKDPPW